MDNLGIKIKAILDANTKDINTQIQQLSTKIDKLKVKIALDTTDLKNINQIMQDIKNLMSVNNKKFKVFDGEQIKKDGIEVYTSIEKIEEKYKSLGRVTFPNKILDPVTKELTGLTVQVEKANGIVEKFKYNLINIQNGSNIDKGFILNSLTQSDRTAQIQERALQETQKINLKIQQENQKISKQKMDLLHAEALEMNKVYDASAKAFAQAEQRKRNELQRTSQQQAQLSNKALQENYNRMLNEAYSMNRAFDAERQRTFNLGTNLNSQTSGFTGTSKGSVEQYAKEIYGADAAVTKFIQTMNRNGQIISEATVRVNKNSKEYTEYKLKVDEATKSVNQFGEAVNRKTGKDMGIFEQFKVALERFPIWIASATLFMGIIHQIKNSINYIVEMDTAITNLSKVTNLSVEQLEQMRLKSLELGEELGRTSVQIAKSMAEFGRVFKDTQSIEELSRVAVMFSNVTSMTADEAAKVLNTSMITFKKDVSDAMGILDSFNEIQNNFRKFILCGSKTFSN